MKVCMEVCDAAHTCSVYMQPLRVPRILCLRTCTAENVMQQSLDDNLLTENKNYATNASCVSENA